MEPVRAKWPRLTWCRRGLKRAAGAQKDARRNERNEYGVVLEVHGEDEV